MKTNRSECPTLNLKTLGTHVELFDDSTADDTHGEYVSSSAKRPAPFTYTPKATGPQTKRVTVSTTTLE